MLMTRSGCHGAGPLPISFGVFPMKSMAILHPRRWLSVPAFLLLAALAPGQELGKAIDALKSGEWKSAIEIADKVSADSTEFARAQYVCGEAHLVLNDAKMAEASFRRVLELNANATPALIGLGRALSA